MDGPTMRLFTVDVISYAPPRCNIMRLTPPMNGAAAPDRRRISYDASTSAIVSLYPTYLPPRQ